MKKYEAPELVIIAIDSADVLTGMSGGVQGDPPVDPEGPGAIN